MYIYLLLMYYHPYIDPNVRLIYINNFSNQAQLNHENNINIHLVNEE